ncbi:AsmA-like C-terminal region-containing protein [Celerinatantimonas diazotrophica]|uniref:AsmA-like protein n=1 Tax=Celerinatantimonas diazotrophica TaxID=412034 RepID=A0A4R1KEZ2_9GAMM|nr:AsmA-like C-terminal region-containing protein [Celerinatantimonas diazotrophica]TCK63298.1 AsmA-like protein [Celerinatantimonas diazotrophica]CAG9298442.1 hypothetical protein CEDIAZO_03647 [Celerinatantimonas diazotrophica]
MRWIRDLFFIIILILLCAVTFFIFSFNPDDYQNQLHNWALRQGWHINYQQSHWQFTDPFTWQLDNVSLAKAGDVALLSPHISLTLKPLALFSGKLELAQLNLTRPKITFALNRRASWQLHIPAISHYQIDNINIQNAQISWQDRHGKIPWQLENAQLEIRNWHQHGNTPWQLRGISDALKTPEGKLTQPQFDLHISHHQWQIKQLNFQLAGATIETDGAYHAGQLALNQMQIDGLKLQPAQLSDVTLPSLPEFIQSVDINDLELNSANLQTQLSHIPLVVNNLNGDIRLLHWQRNTPQALTGNFDLTINNMLFSQLPIGNLSLQGALSGQSLAVNQLSAQLQPGQLNASFNYNWQKQPNLDITSLNASNAVIALSDTSEQTIKTLRKVWPVTLKVDQASFNDMKLLSYNSALPLSIRSMELSLSDLKLLDQGQFVSLKQALHPDTSIFWQAPDVAFRGLIINNASVDLGPDQNPDQTHINLYGELPQGQLQWQATLQNQQPSLPWNGKLSVLILDISPLSRLTSNSDFKLGGDLEIDGHLSGALSKGLSSVNGQLSASSSQLAFNRNLQPLWQQLLKDPKTSLPAHQELLTQGVSALWQDPKQIPEGTTLFNQAKLNVDITQGVIQVDQTQLSSQPYNWLVSGQIDLNNQQYNALSIGVTDQGCVLLSQLLDGPWRAPQVRIDQYQIDQSYLPQTNTFVKDSQSSGKCQLKPVASPAQ